MVKSNKNMFCWDFSGIIKFSVQAFLLPVLLSSCEAHNDGSQIDDTNRLYHNLCKITIAYTDSLANARDTTDIQRIVANYELAFEKACFDVPPDTDFNMSEGKNDTIKILQDKFLNTKTEMSHRILNMHLTSDTIKVKSELKI